MRIVDGDVVLEPFASAGELEVVIPEPAERGRPPGRPWHRRRASVFVLPSDVEAPVLQIDGGDTVVCGEAGTEFSDLDQSDGQRCAYLPEGGFPRRAPTPSRSPSGADGTAVDHRRVDPLPGRA